MFTLRGWSGAALFVSDSTASQLCDLNRGPPPSSALSIPYRAALLSASFRMHEAWLPAQHDSGSASHLATLNAEADSLARRGLRAASPWTLPWSALFHGRIVTLHEGAIFLSPTRAAEAAYAATTARTHALRLRPLPPGWSSHLLRLAYERAEIAALALHRIMHLRLLHSQDHPPGYGGVTCPFCHRPYLDSAAHLGHHCPPHYALQLLLTWHLFTHPPILAATAGHFPRLVTPFELRTATTAVYLSERLPAAPRPGPPTQLGFSLLGMWHSSSPHGAPPLLDSAGREELLHELLSTLSTTHTSLASLLRRAPSHATAPPPPLPPHVPTPPSTQPHTLRHSIALVWLLRHCATRRLTVDRRPVVPLPPAPLPGPHPAHVVFTPTSRGADILPLLAATPPGHRILLAASPSVLSEVLIGHADALHVRPLLPDLHAAYAPGTPARTTPHSPRALDPLDAATHAPGPGLGPQAALPASRGSHGPQGAPDGHADTLARARPAAWPAQRTRPRHAPGPHGVGPLEPPPTAGWAAHASQRPPRPPHPLGRPPLLIRPAPASAPRQRNQLTAGPSARRVARTGHADALTPAPSAAWPAGRALSRHAHRPHCVGRSGPLPTAGWTARDPPRPPRAPHPHGATSYPAACCYPCARPGLRPPAGFAVRRAQGRAPGNST